MVTRLNYLKLKQLNVKLLIHHGFCNPPYNILGMQVYLASNVIRFRQLRELVEPHPKIHLQTPFPSTLIECMYF